MENFRKFLYFLNLWTMHCNIHALTSLVQCSLYRSFRYMWSDTKFFKNPTFFKQNLYANRSARRIDIIKSLQKVIWIIFDWRNNNNRSIELVLFGRMFKIYFLYPARFVRLSVRLSVEIRIRLEREYEGEPKFSGIFVLYSSQSGINKWANLVYK